jgi:two-component system, NtrC family, sensor histidine kinase HydH
MRMPNTALVSANMVPVVTRPPNRDQSAALGQLAAGVAHGIRNPLTSIQLLVQTLYERSAVRSTAAKDLKIIEHELRRIERCVQSLLDYAHPPVPHFRPLDLAQQVALVLTVIASRARAQGVAVEFDPPAAAVMVMGDFDQLHHLLLNLTLNALDAMKTGGELQIDLTDAAHDQLELCVRDTGHGIAAALLPVLFQPFLSTKETGLGLGLATARQYAEAHGGALTAANKPDGGACFTLRLPALRA